MRLIYFVLITACIASCSVSKNSTKHKMAFADNIVVAHRGAFKKNGFPENSIASLREAIRLQCAGSEFDVRMSSDDSLVINHDPHYQKLEIEKTSYHDLTQVKLSNGEVLPTLYQTLVAGLENNKGTLLVIEIKPSDISKERARLVADKVVNLVRDLHAQSKVAYISFDYDVLKRIIEIEPGASTQYLNGDHSPEQLKADRVTGADYNISVFRKHPEWIDLAKKNGIVLNAWTVNTEEDMKWLMMNKFEFITTNEPELLLSLAKDV